MQGTSSEVSFPSGNVGSPELSAVPACQDDLVKLKSTMVNQGHVNGSLTLKCLTFLFKDSCEPQTHNFPSCNPNIPLQQFWDLLDHHEVTGITP